MRRLFVVMTLLELACAGPREESRRDDAEREKSVRNTRSAEKARRRFQMPLTAAEATLVFPALVSVAQSMGLQASQAEDRAYVKLDTGDELLWWVDDVKFQMQATLGNPALPANEIDLKMRDLKVRADQIWDLAIEQRQKNNVGAVVVQQKKEPPPPPPQQPQQWPQPQPQYQQPYQQQQPQFGVGRSRGGGFAQPQQQQQMAPMTGQGCRSSLDCASGQWCKDRGDGANVCMGGGGQGSPCTSSLDCEGMWCRGSGIKTCQP